MALGVSAGLVLTVTVTVLGGSFQFYNFAVINPLQEVIKQWINVTYSERYGTGLSENTLTIFFSFTVSVVCLGALLGCVFSRRIAESLGRRNGLIANGLVNIFGALLVGICKGVASPELLIIGRLILGINLGLTSALAPMYLTEIAPVKYRGAVATTHQIAVAFADCISLAVGLPDLLGTERLWPLAFVLPAIPAIILCIVLPLCHESPRHLLIKLGNREAAEKSVAFFAGPTLVKESLELLIREAAQVQLDRRREIRVGDLFKYREYRSPLFICLLVMIAQQFTGVAAVFAYSTEMLNQAGLTLDVARVSTVGIGVAYFFFTIPAIYLVEKWGRRKLSLFQLSCCLLALVLITLFTALYHDYQLAWASSASVGVLVFYMCVYGIGSPVPWMVTSELFTQDYRSAAVAMSTFVAYLGAFIISTFYLPFQELVGPAYSFLPFALVLFILLILVAVLLPETRGKTIDEIVREYRNRRRTVTMHFTGHLGSTSGVGANMDIQPLLSESKRGRKYYGGIRNASSGLSVHSEGSSLTSMRNY